MSTDNPKIKAPKKLIEVALPLDAINKASVREKSIRHGHPSTLHLWWARRPLAAARAVLFAQLVNDPGGERGWGKFKGQTKEDAAKERQRLFRLIERLVQWENTNNEELLDEAREEIRKSWRETCEMNKGLPGFDPEKLPPFHDPFAGGGSIPLEAQRLGLEAHASDLNPVAVLINKAMIEIPPKFAGHPPVGPLPEGRKQRLSKATEDWSGTKGLAEDVRRYGAWMREQAFKKIGDLYPPVKITGELAKDRPDLKKYVGQERTVIAWLWCRTVPSPNPAMGGAHVPLISSYWLSKKKGKEAYLEPVIEGKKWRFVVRKGKPKTPKTVGKGTKSGRAKFECLLTKTPISSTHIREQADKGNLLKTMIAVVAEGERERIYLNAPEGHISNPSMPATLDLSSPIPRNPRWFSPPEYGMLRFEDVFMARQIASIETFSTLARNLPGDSQTNGHDREYFDAISTYLAFCIDKISEALSTLCTWSSAAKNELVVGTFRRQALPMTWDFAEANPFAGSSGSPEKASLYISKCIEAMSGSGGGLALQSSIMTAEMSGAIVSTDPPYYDNIGYSDLSDYFYVLMKGSLGDIYPKLFSTMVAPKSDELIADPYRHGGKDSAEEFFFRGMKSALCRISGQSNPAYPSTVYYAFKQSESRSDGTSSTGWETFIDAVINSGFSVTGTWPMRTERSGRTIEIGTNALASSIVLVCRPRPDDAPSVSRRQFLRELKKELPLSLELMISGAEGQSPVAPVDLQQAAIGPGMAIFSKYKEVLEADGSAMPVRQALIHINRAIDDYFSEAEGDIDADSRFCLTWFEQHGFDKGKFGDADVLARAKGTSVEGLAEAGVIEAERGDVRLFKVRELKKDWDPREDKRVPTWEALHQLCRALDESELAAGTLLATMPDKQEPVRQLAYRLHIFCERTKRAEDALRYNTLMTSWSVIVEHSQRVGVVGEQLTLG